MEILHKEIRDFIQKYKDISTPGIVEIETRFSGMDKSSFERLKKCCTSRFGKVEKVETTDYSIHLKKNVVSRTTISDGKSSTIIKHKIGKFDSKLFDYRISVATERESSSVKGSNFFVRTKKRYSYKHPSLPIGIDLTIVNGNYEAEVELLPPRGGASKDLISAFVETVVDAYLCKIGSLLLYTNKERERVLKEIDYYSSRREAGRSPTRREGRSPSRREKSSGKILYSSDLGIWMKGATLIRVVDGNYPKSVSSFSSMCSRKIPVIEIDKVYHSEGDIEEIMEKGIEDKLFMLICNGN